MASFKTHISFGILIGIGAVAASLVYALVNDQSVLFWIFLAVFTGSILPDLDSDDSTPLNLLFMLIGSIAACLSVIYLFQEGIKDFKYLIGIPAVLFVLIRVVVMPIFKKFTHHRGMFHSVPALLIAFLGTNILISSYDIGSQDKILISLALGIGYLGHLILDEIKSTVGFHGLIYRPKKSLGTALKFFSHSKKTTIAAYLILGALYYINSEPLKQTYELFNRAI